MTHTHFLFDFHIPINLRQYRFFEIGKEHHYIDDYQLETTTVDVAQNFIEPFCLFLLQTIDTFKQNVRLSISISGSSIKLLQVYAPETLELLKEVVSFEEVKLCSTLYTQSSLSNTPQEISRLLELNQQMANNIFPNIECCFNLTNANLDSTIYKQLEQFHPERIYLREEQVFNAFQSNIPVAIVNNKLSTSLTTLLTEKESDLNTLTVATKFINQIKAHSRNQKQLFIQFKPNLLNSKFGVSQALFMQDLFEGLLKNEFIIGGEFCNECENSQFDVIYYEHIWHRFQSQYNDMQLESIDFLNNLYNLVTLCNDKKLIQDWIILQDQAHIKYMSTDYLNEDFTENNYSPFNSPYQAFMNYMNILKDFKYNLDRVLKKSAVYS